MKSKPEDEKPPLFDEIMNQIEIMKNKQIEFTLTVGEFIETINTNIDQKNTFTDENNNSN